MTDERRAWFLLIPLAWTGSDGQRKNGGPAGSIAAYNLFWNNGSDSQGSNVDTSTSLFGDPLLDGDYRLLAGSPAIDAGTANFVWNGQTVLDIPPDDYDGAAPDLGWSELPDCEIYLPLIVSDYQEAAGQYQIEVQDRIGIRGMGLGSMW